jgi:hypothetical protein
MFKSIRQLIASIGNVSGRALARVHSAEAKSRSLKNRSLTLETLENRELLSISAVGAFSVAQFQTTFAAYEDGAKVQQKYADLKLNNELNHYQFIDIV